MYAVKKWGVLFLIVFMLVLTGCSGGDSASTDGDTDGDITGDVCDTCGPGEACIGPEDGFLDPICAAPCVMVGDCLEPNMRCVNFAPPGSDFSEGYCLPEDFCNDASCPKFCETDADCIYVEHYVCDHTTGECVPRNETDGDLDGTDGDTDAVVVDGDKDIEISEQPADPQVIYTNPCDFGSVAFGMTGECEITFENIGPTREACLIYALDQNTEEFAEFYIDEEDVLEDGQSVCLPVGSSWKVLVHYTPNNPGADTGSMEVIVTGEPISRFYVDLVSREKGEVHAYTTPEPPSPLDFERVRLESFRTLPVTIENRRVGDSDNKTMIARNFRFDAPEDLNFEIEDSVLNDQGEILLAPGQQTDLPITCHPIREGEHTNTLIFETNDSNNPLFEIDVICEGVQPRICATPYPVLFGEVALDTRASEYVEVCNCGGYELNIEEVGIEPPEALAFIYQVMDATLPITLPTAEDAIDGNDCIQVKVSYLPNRQGSEQAYLEILSNAPGNNIFQIPLAGTGVGATICTQPTTPIDFGVVRFGSGSGGASATPKDFEIYNCGPAGTSAYVCCIDMQNDTSTPDGTFSITNPDAGQVLPSGCDNGTEDFTGCIALAGDQRIRLTLNYEPTEHGTSDSIQHKSIIRIPAKSSSTHDLTHFVEVFGIASECEEGWYDLSPDVPGCEYQCDYEDSWDEPDMDFKDSNCDGIDGMIERAIFVSQSGSDETGDGSMDNPFRNVNTGVFSAINSGKIHVYVSEGTYFERVQLLDTISVYGGYRQLVTSGELNEAPLGWKRAITHTSIFQGGQVGLDANLLMHPTTLQFVTIYADNGSDSNKSSYGIYSRSSNGLVLENVRVFAGAGREGAYAFNGGENGEVGYSGTSGQSGREDDSTFYCNKEGRPNVGVGGRSNCDATGGNGGYSCKTGGSSCAGYTGGSGVGGAEGGPGHTGSYGSQGQSGSDGYNGAQGEGGTNEGYLTEGLWEPNDGQHGSAGGNGGGGGGGGGGGSSHSTLTCEDWGGTGGGGGGGGCGGTGGGGGEGGGSSFALFLYDSSPFIISCEFNTDNGGNGGNGRQGGEGGRGGDGAPGGEGYDEGKAGGPGGNGGWGGDGGSGGGGAGGLCIGIYRAGTSQPTMDGENTFSLGRPGFGGSPGDAVYGYDGEDGFKADVYPEM